MEKPSPFELSDPDRIAQVRDKLIRWMTDNKIEFHELRRAEALHMRQEAERAKELAMKGGHN